MALTPNVEELDRLLAWAAGERIKQLAGLPSEWDQQTWAGTAVHAGKHGVILPAGCETACCLAGKEVALAGGKMLIHPGLNFAQAAEMPDGTVANIGDKARELLGLTLGQADALFYSENKLNDLARIIEDIKDGVADPLYPDHPDWNFEDEEN